MSGPFRDDPKFRAEWDEWELRVQTGLVPKLEGSAIVMQLVPKDGKPDIKFAVEIGLSILMNKPIIAIVLPGVRPPPKLIKVADKVLYIDPKDASGQAQLQAALAEFAPKFSEDE